MVNVQKGERFEVRMDFPTTALTHWKAPVTDGLPCTLPKGTILVVASDSPPSRVAFSCVPEDWEAFLSRHIPEDVRLDPKFAGISFVIEKEEIGSKISPA